MKNNVFVCIMHMYSAVCGGTQLANCTAQSTGPVDCRWLRQSADGCAVGRYYRGAVCRATQSADDVTELRR